MKLLYSEHKKDTVESKNLKSRIAVVLKAHAHDTKRAKGTLTELATPNRSLEDTLKTTQSMNEKTFEEVRKIHDDIKNGGNKVSLPKNRFLNWDPVKIFNGEPFNPREIIQSTRQI